MLSAGVRAKLAALLYDEGFTGIARLLAEGTTDVYELTHAVARWATGDTPEPVPGSVGSALRREAFGTIAEACRAVQRTGRAQLVLVTPDGEGVWKVPELVGTVPAIAERRDPVIRRAPTPEEMAAAQDGTGPGIRMVYGRDGEDGLSFEFVSRDA